MICEKRDSPFKFLSVLKVGWIFDLTISPGDENLRLRSLRAPRSVRRSLKRADKVQLKHEKEHKQNRNDCSQHPGRCDGNTKEFCLQGKEQQEEKKNKNVKCRT